METTTMKLSDTIIIFVRDSIAQSDITDVYKKIIETQSADYLFLVYIFLGILGIFAFGTWFYNIKIEI